MGSKSAQYTPPPPVDYAAEARQRKKEETEMSEELDQERADLIRKKKTGRYSTLLTGGEGLLDEAESGKKSLLGEG